MLGLDDAVLSAWIDSCGAQGNYNRTLRYMMGLYADFLMRRNLRFDFVTAEDIGDFAARLSADHTTAVVDRTLCAVRRFYAWCDDERLAPNVAKGVEAAERCRSYSKKPISSADARRIIGSCDDDRSRAVCSLLIRAALKPGEVLLIDVGDVMLSKSFGEIRLRGSGYAALSGAASRTSAHMSPRGSPGPVPPARLSQAQGTGTLAGV